MDLIINIVLLVILGIASIWLIIKAIGIAFRLVLIGAVLVLIYYLVQHLL